MDYLFIFCSATAVTRSSSSSIKAVVVVVVEVALVTAEVLYRCCSILYCGVA